MKPLGISVLRTLFPVGDRSPSGESDLLQEAGCRVFVDLNPVLRYRRLRQLVPRVVLPLADERIARAVPEFLQREEYRAALRPDKRVELSWPRRSCSRSSGPSCSETWAAVGSTRSSGPWPSGSLSGGEGSKRLQARRR